MPQDIDTQRDVSPKPAFPIWLRRLDPTLEAEDTNALFQAFRLRRKVHRTPLKNVFRAPGSMAPGQIAAVIVYILFSILLFWIFTCCAVPVIVGVGAVLARSFQGKRITGGRLPMRISGVFSVGGYMEEAALDLWMAGATGQEVLEAIYLERRESTWRTTIIAWAVLLAIPVWIYLGNLQSPSVVCIVLTITWLLLSWQLILMILVGGIGSARENQLKPRLSAWASGNSFGDAMTAGLLRGLMSFVIIFAIVIGSWVVISIPLSIFNDPGVAAWLRDVLPAGIRTHLWEWITAFGIFWTAGVLLSLRPLLRDRSIRKHRETLAQATAAFDIFMAGKVANDPIGADWARWLDRTRRGAAVLASLPPIEPRRGQPPGPPPQA